MNSSSTSLPIRWTLDHPRLPNHQLDLMPNFCMIPCLQNLLPNISTTLLLLLIFLAMTIKLLRGSFQPLKFHGKVLGKISSYPTPTSKVSRLGVFLTFDVPNRSWHKFLFMGHDIANSKHAVFRSNLPYVRIVWFSRDACQNGSAPAVSRLLFPQSKARSSRTPGLLSNAARPNASVKWLVGSIPVDIENAYLDIHSWK